MESAKVIEACNARIEHILSVRKERNEQTIAKAMARKVRVNWWNLTLKRTRTREEAIKYLDENVMFGWRSGYEYDDLEHSRKLLNLAQHGDPVTLNEEDCHVLF